MQSRLPLHKSGSSVLNHEGSLAGTPIGDIQPEPALVFESAVEAADTARTETGKFRILGKDLQQVYVGKWKEAKDELR